MRTFVVAVAAALALSACQDPAGVGVGLIDEGEANPSVVTVALGDIDSRPSDVPAIGLASTADSNPRPQTRVLVGDVTDPTFGDARAIGYVDAIQPSAAQDVDPDSVRAVWLQMPRVYTYGDTTATLPVELRQIQGEWEDDPSYSVDTTFAVGPTLATVDIAQADTLVRFDLPESWVTSNAATLVGDDFLDAFEGFALQTAPSFAPMPGVVYGLGTLGGASGGGIRVVVGSDSDGGADTLTFPLSEVFSSLAASPPTAAPMNLQPVRRGSATDVGFTADLSAYYSFPLARAMLVLPVDESLAQSGTFVRPLATSSILYGIREVDDDDDVFAPLGIVTIADGQAVLSETSTLTRVIQNLLLDPENGEFDRYAILPDVNREFAPASLDILPIVLPMPGEVRPPRFTLTLIGVGPVSS